jgi:hypothetical protein
MSAEVSLRYPSKSRFHIGNSLDVGNYFITAKAVNYVEDVNTRVSEET